MSYYYMFSQGSYSDYCIGGLYKSEIELSEEYFMNHLREMLLNQVKGWSEAEEYISNLPDLAALSYYLLQRNLFELELGEQQNWRDKEVHDAWQNGYSKLRESTGKLDQDFIQDLVNKGILHSIEYEEIWCDS